MKRILYNTIKNKIEGSFFTGDFNGIYNSMFSAIPSELPEYVIILSLIDNPIQVNFETEVLTSNVVIDLENKEYRIEYSKRDKTTYEIAMESWQHPQFAKRIIAPVSLMYDESGIGVIMKIRFDLDKLPVEKVGSFVHVYCKEVQEEDAAIIAQLQGLITIEDRPVDESLIEPTPIEV
jgi:hypothetical protein